MTAADPTYYPTDRCPLCQGPNQCAIVANNGDEDACSSCWCKNVQVPANVLAQIPKQARGRACICAQCANTDPNDVARRSINAVDPPSASDTDT